MAEIRVTASQIKSQAENLQHLNEQFRAKVEEMSGLEETLASSWDGEAKEAFRNAFRNTDMPKWDSFAKVIDQFVQAMMTIYDKYVTAEQTAHTIASQRS